MSRECTFEQAYLALQFWTGTFARHDFGQAHPRGTSRECMFEQAHLGRSESGQAPPGVARPGVLKIGAAGIVTGLRSMAA
jgi:hypothetical protein